MPAPPLAIALGSEKPVDNLGEGVRRSVVTKALYSAGVGGRPVRSRVTRRSKVRRSAGGAGFSPFASNFARIKASMGVRTHDGFLTSGVVVFHRTLKGPKIPPRANIRFIDRYA